MVLCFGNVSSYANAADVKMLIYKNQRGSTLTLQLKSETNSTGTLSGTFNTIVGNCKKDMNTPVPISGFYNEQAVVIAVNFPHCHQVVAMTGNMTQNNEMIYMTWLDTQSSNDPLKTDWSINLTGSDLYKKIR